MRRTRIIATLGPATDGDGVLDGLIAAGVDVVRLNGAHSRPPELSARLEDVRAAARAARREISVLLDLPGAKVRIGEMAEGALLLAGEEFELASEECIGDAHRACVNHAGLARDVTRGDRILIDDGRIEVVVESTGVNGVTTRVITGGVLASRKGINVPGVTLSVDSLTPYDAELVAWAQENSVDWIGQSFVRSASDVEALHALMGDVRIPVVAKIEKHEATSDIGAIIRAADAVMVARGDLAVETSPEAVPVLQRRIVTEARAAGRPVIVATEMLDSMRENPRPTRAEASDVANAIFVRVDAVMLSGETAVGRYPVESVATMARIADTAEAAAGPPRAPGSGLRDDVQAAMSSAVNDLASELELAAIVTLTQSGATALAVSRYRPNTPIVAVVPTPEVARRLALVWGVRTLIAPLPADTRSLIDGAVEEVRSAGVARAGDRVAITAGLGSNIAGGTDFVHVHTL
jgi:pyruvate kinase